MRVILKRSGGSVGSPVAIGVLGHERAWRIASAIACAAPPGLYATTSFESPSVVPRLR